MTEQNPFVSPRTMKLSDLVDLSPLEHMRDFPGATTKKKKKGQPPFGPASHSFEKAFAPTSTDSGLNWSGINAGGVNIGSNTASGPATAMSEAMIKFMPFLESLETKRNAKLISTIKIAFEACFDAVSPKKD
jgi:hypothetical protein